MASRIPELSVIVPSVNGADDLLPCLAALQRASRDTSLEVVVADRCGPSLRELVQQQYPDVRVLAAPPGTTIPDLRALAFDASTAPSVAVIEDHVQVHATWPRELLDAQSTEAPVVGGAVYNAATATTLDWAAFLCEYSHLLPPLPSGPSTWLTGNNTVYRRSVLEAHRHVLGGGRWENQLHDALRESGVPLTFRPEIRVAHKKHYTFWEYFSQRYLYSRSFAGARLAASPLPRRLFYGAAAFALPPVLFGRIVGRVWSRGGHRPELLRSLPLLVTFVCAWAAGDVVGAWFGPGQSLSRVR
jgi:glycosyltransferase involved in cell wall biosynthesis